MYHLSTWARTLWHKSAPSAVIILGCTQARRSGHWALCVLLFHLLLLLVNILNVLPLPVSCCASGHTPSASNNVPIIWASLASFKTSLPPGDLCFLFLVLFLSFWENHTHTHVLKLWEPLFLLLTLGSFKKDNGRKHWEVMFPMLVTMWSGYTDVYWRKDCFSDSTW